jgi:hypothetical protein
MPVSVSGRNARTSPGFCSSRVCNARHDNSTTVEACLTDPWIHRHSIASYESNPEEGETGEEIPIPVQTDPSHASQGGCSVPWVYWCMCSPIGLLYERQTNAV